MNKTLILCNAMLLLSIAGYAQKLHDVFNQNRTIEYADLISEYKKLDAASPQMKLLEYGETDAGYPVHLLVINAKQNFEPPAQNSKDKLVVLVMSGIHPGESEGIDASLLFAQQLAYKKVPIPENVTICLIPVYNVEGMLNRRKYTRTNQNGPVEKGFRGTARNFDLNRDFIKADAKNTFAFYKIYHEWNPDVFLDNHTSNGADYQYTMTLIATQRQKLGGAVADVMHDSMVPALYKEMETKKWEMIPYVHVFGKSPDDGGYEEFVEGPKFSTGYTSLFGTLGFVAETHMLKPYPARVEATLALMHSMVNYSATHVALIRNARIAERDARIKRAPCQTNFTIDRTVPSSITFKGYEAEKRKSEVGNYERIYYNREKPYTKQIPYYKTAKPKLTIALPSAYVVPSGWFAVIDRLRASKVQLRKLERDTVIVVNVSYVTEYTSSDRPYEGHHSNSNVHVEKRINKMRFAKGDYIISTAQQASRYIAEVLEPETEDGFFAWNFFDGVLGQKEGFSDYAFEDDAARIVAEDAELKRKLDEWKAANPDKKDNGREVLGFIFRNSYLYEPEHMRVPVYRLE